MVAKEKGQDMPGQKGMLIRKLTNKRKARHIAGLRDEKTIVNAIAQRLGHTPAMTLKTYAHVYKDQDAEIAAMLERKLNPNQFKKNWVFIGLM